MGKFDFQSTEKNRQKANDAAKEMQRKVDASQGGYDKKKKDTKQNKPTGLTALEVTGTKPKKD